MLYDCVFGDVVSAIKKARRMVSDEDWKNYFNARHKANTKSRFWDRVESIAEMLLIAIVTGIAMAIIASTFIPPVRMWTP